MRQPISFSRDLRRSSRSFPLIKGLMRCFLQAAPRPEDTGPHSRLPCRLLSKNKFVRDVAATIVKTNHKGKRNSGDDPVRTTAALKGATTRHRGVRARVG